MNGFKQVQNLGIKLKNKKIQIIYHSPRIRATETWILGNYPDYNLELIKMLFLKNVSGDVSNIRTPKEKKLCEYAL
ncbi:MAG: histidine phosphatase family protein [DPANN group archaeon]|nr:histidine phosphatase family protein [DPANN group archaeon]